MKETGAKPLISNFWKMLSGNPENLHSLRFTGPLHVLPSVYDVTSFASATVAAATLAAAELKAARSGRFASEFPVVVDHLESSAAFISELLFEPVGWEMPPLWDPIAGNYLSLDQKWIRLHTNYAHHRDAVLRVLGVEAQKEAVKKAVSTWVADDLEAAVVAEGGCAAVMRSKNEWKTHPQGKFSVNEDAISLVKVHEAKASFGKLLADALPLQGIRVLDLTRVIAGPECTRFLSAYGASVLRLDPPGFEEVPALLPETTLGKKRAFLDYTSETGNAQLIRLIQKSHVLVYGLRADALEKLGLSLERIYEINPSIVISTHNAYGWQGEWKTRRGFDSLVQMSCGINAAGAEARGTSEPVPLPAQALDHGTGYLLGAGICRSLTELYQNQKLFRVQGSLVGAANTLMQTISDLELPLPERSDFHALKAQEQTAWGPARRVQCPGMINGLRATWSIPAGSLGTDQAEF